jgi:hypothetical protein
VQISPDVTVSHVRDRLQINVRGKAHVLYHRAHTHTKVGVITSKWIIQS